MAVGWLFRPPRIEEVGRKNIPLARSTSACTYRHLDTRCTRFSSSSLPSVPTLSSLFPFTCGSMIYAQVAGGSGCTFALRRLCFSSPLVIAPFRRAFPPSTPVLPPAECRSAVAGYSPFCGLLSSLFPLCLPPGPPFPLPLLSCSVRSALFVVPRLVAAFALTSRSSGVVGCPPCVSCRLAGGVPVLSSFCRPAAVGAALFCFPFYSFPRLFSLSRCVGLLPSPAAFAALLLSGLYDSANLLRLTATCIY